MTLDRRCPECRAEIGAPCVTADGLVADQTHVERRPVDTGSGPNWAAVRKLERMQPSKRAELLKKRAETGQWLISGGYDGLSGPEEYPEGYGPS